MTEKRYKGNKYVDCYCSKRTQVLVGIDIYKYLTLVGTIGGIVFMLWLLSLGLSILDKLMAICIFGIPAVVLPTLSYQDTKKTMLKAGHSEECSRKIARMVMFRAGLWSEFKIMKDKDDGKRLWR